MDNRYNRHNRRKYNLKVHIVLVTKYRKQLLKDSIADDVKQKIFDIANAYGYEIIAIETDKDHIHFLLSYDTTDKVFDIVKIVKQETTYYLWHKYEAGFSEGEKHGIELNSIETARRMLQLQEFSLEKIAAITSLPFDEVKKLQTNEVRSDS